MDMKYRIINVAKHELVASATVQYYTDDFPNGYIYNVDIDVDANGVPMNAEQLHEKIMFHAPHGQIEQAVKMKAIAPTLDLSHLASLVEPLPAEHPLSKQAAPNQPPSQGAVEI